VPPLPFYGQATATHIAAQCRGIASFGHRYQTSSGKSGNALRGGAGDRDRRTARGECAAAVNEIAAERYGVIWRLPKLLPLLIVNVPLATVAELKFFVPVPAKVTTLNVVALTESVWAAPPKLTVPVPAVNSEPVSPQAVALVLFRLTVLDPPLSVPAESVTSPVMCGSNPSRG